MTATTIEQQKQQTVFSLEVIHDKMISFVMSVSVSMIALEKFCQLTTYIIYLLK